MGPLTLHLPWLLPAVALLSGCGPQRQVEIQLNASACACAPSRLEFYLLRANEGCAGAFSSSAGLGGESVLSLGGGNSTLLAMVLAYASRSDASVTGRGSFCAGDGAPPAGKEAGLKLDIAPCGDKVCKASQGETCKSCPKDCGPCPPEAGPAGGDISLPRDIGSPKCGNKLCETGETCKSCPGDCGACKDLGSKDLSKRDSLSDSGQGCGDKVCQAGETCQSCPEDCGGCTTQDGLTAPGCVCCYALGVIQEGDQRPALNLVPSTNCTIPSAALRAAGRDGLAVPPSRCP